jgi:hypothetical protein
MQYPQENWRPGRKCCIEETMSSTSSFAPYCDACPIRLAGVSGSDDAPDCRSCLCRFHARCSRCGWPITDDAEHPNHHYLCAACEREELTRGWPPEDLHELPARLAALGLPPDVPVTFHLLLGSEVNDDWSGYRVELALIPDVAWRHAPTNRVVEYPLRVLLPSRDSPQAVLRWRQWRVDAPEFLEHFFRRQGGRRILESQVRAVDGLQSPRRVRDFAQLLQGHKGPGRGRADLDAWLKEDLHPEIVATIAAGQRPDQRTLADRLGLSLQGLQKRFSKLNQQRRESGRKALSWKRLVADIQTTLRR